MGTHHTDEARQTPFVGDIGTSFRIGSGQKEHRGRLDKVLLPVLQVPVQIPLLYAVGQPAAVEKILSILDPSS